MRKGARKWNQFGPWLFCQKREAYVISLVSNWVIILLDKETRHFPCHYPRIDRISFILSGDGVTLNYRWYPLCWKGGFVFKRFQAVVSNNCPVRTGTANYGSNILLREMFCIILNSHFVRSSGEVEVCFLMTFIKIRWLHFCSCFWYLLLEASWIISLSEYSKMYTVVNHYFGQEDRNNFFGEILTLHLSISVIVGTHQESK